MNIDDEALLSWMTYDGFIKDENKSIAENIKMILENAKKYFAIADGEWYNKTNEKQYIIVNKKRIAIKSGERIVDAVSKSIQNWKNGFPLYNWMIPQIITKIEKILRVGRTFSFSTKNAEIIKIKLWINTSELFHIVLKLLDIRDDKNFKQKKAIRTIPQMEDFYDSLISPNILYNQNKEEYNFVFKTCNTIVGCNGQIKNIFLTSKERLKGIRNNNELYRK